MTDQDATSDEPSFPSLWQLRSRFPNEAACVEYLIAKRLQAGDFCGTGQDCKFSRDRGMSAVLRCRTCHRRYSPRTATLTYNSNVSLLKWFELLWLFSAMPEGLTVDFVRRYLGISHVAAWRMLLNLRRHIDAQRRSVQLGGDGRPVVMTWTNLRVRTSRRRTLLVFALEDGKEISSLTCPDRRTKYIRHFLSERITQPAQLSIPDRFDCKMAVRRYGNSVAVRDSSDALGPGGKSSFVAGLNGWVKRIYKHIRPDYAALYVREKEFRMAYANSSGRMFARLMKSFPAVEG